MHSSFFEQMVAGSKKIDRLRFENGPGSCSSSVSSARPAGAAGLCSGGAGAPAPTRIPDNLMNGVALGASRWDPANGRPINLPETPFLGQFTGMAVDGYCLWFMIVDLEVRDMYEMLMSSLRKDVREETIRPLAEEEIREDIPVLALTKDGVLVRGAIMAIPRDADGKVIMKKRVSVCDLDSISVVKIPVKNLYQWVPRAYTVPFLAMKVELAGLQLLGETVLVANAVDQCQISEKTIFKAVKSRQEPSYNGSYCLDLYDLHGRNLSTRLLQALEHVCVPPLFPPAGPEGMSESSSLPIIITHWLDEGGLVFYQVNDGRNETKLVEIVENFDYFIRRNLDFVRETIPGYSNVEAVKARLEVPKHIFAAPYKTEDKYYRAELLEFSDNDQVLVRFVDYGNDEVVSLSEIVLLDAFDEVLAYLPPQARLVKVLGIDHLDERMGTLVDNFSEFTLQVVEEFDDGCEFPLVNILAKTEGTEKYIPLKEAIAKTKA